MGNTNIKSSDTLSNLKVLYGSNEEKLKELRERFYNQRRLEYINDERNILNKIEISQEKLRNSGKIPSFNLLKVDNFLNQIKNDINEFELRNIKSSYENRVFDKLGVEEIDYYKIYGYSKKDKIDVNELKQKFKKYAIQTHPDRNNGNNNNFNIIKAGYEKIMDDIETKKVDKDFNVLKNNSIDFLQTQNKNQNTKFNKDNFEINKFNKVYSENRVNDVNDDGYEEWITDNAFDSEEIQRNNKLSGNMGQFNRIFDSTVIVNKGVIQKYSDPKELFMNNYNNCSELGIDKLDNYTGETKTIKFTDYKEAHTTSKLIDSKTKYKQYNNISELEHARSNIKDFTKDELEYYNQKQIQQELDDKKRLEKQDYMDSLHFQNYERLNKIMLQ
jgi:hypothetical protein